MQKWSKRAMHTPPLSRQSFERNGRRIMLAASKSPADKNNSAQKLNAVAATSCSPRQKMLERVRV